jgi:Tyrosinase co-factor MelC1
MVTRRRVLRTGLTTMAAVGGTAAALRPMLAAGQPSPDPVGQYGPEAAFGSDSDTPIGDPHAESGSGTGDITDDATTPLFDEVYRERRIQGFGSPDPDGMRILIDGRPLRVMRRVDGSWISMANHYQPYLTPLATARGAVDVIGGAELSTAAVHHH